MANVDTAHDDETQQDQDKNTANNPKLFADNGKDKVGMLCWQSTHTSLWAGIKTQSRHPPPLQVGKTEICLPPNTKAFRIDCGVKNH